MTKNWQEIKDRAVADGLDLDQVAARRAGLEAEVRAHRLSEVRRSQQVTQASMAKTLGVSQPRVSRIERGDLDHTELATLRGYVEALGGRLRVVADFGDEHLTIG